MFYLQLIQNVALLVSLVVIHGQIIRLWKKNTLRSQVFSGFLFGCVAVIVMMTSVHIAPGVISDGRSIVLSVAGLFGGPIVAGVAAIISVAYRMWLGGPGAFVGVTVILESAGLGVAFYYLRREYPGLTRTLYLLAFGLLIQVGRLLLMMMLPTEGIVKIIQDLAIPVLLIYPVTTLLVCRLFLDLESRVSAGESLRVSEERYRTVADFTYGWEYWVDSEGNFLYVSPSCERITDYSAKEFIDDPDLMNRIIHPDDRTAMLDHYHNVRQVAPHVSDAMDFRIIHRDGETRWIGHVCQPVYGQEGQTLGRRGSNRDITDRKKAEEVQNLLSTAIDQAAEAVIITDSDGVIQYVNPAHEAISGYSRDELIGQTPNILKSDFHDDIFYDELWETISSGNVWSGRFANRKKDGTTYHEDTSISPVYDNSGNLTNFVAVKHDVTAHLSLSEQLIQAQKMEAIGTLAGGFAHDFNNKLQVIGGYVDLMLFNKDLPQTVISELGAIKQTVESSAELIKGMMVFSRKTPVELQPIDLNKLLANLKPMLTRSITKMIQVDLLLADDLWTIKGDKTHIDQILMNLAVNARDAMPDGGKLTIKTRNVVLDDYYCRALHNPKPGRYVLIEVSDTGTGMDKETVGRIFEPFFTTKEPGKGTGLGLAVVYGIVEKHDGRIICHSQPSVGTRFNIYFPAIQAVPEEQYSEKKETPRGQGETILLVDDEPDFVLTTSVLLASANYSVITALNGKEALDLYEKRREEVKLVILDLIMPVMGGKECLQGLLSIDANSSVIMVSGFEMEGLAEELRAAGAKAFILKPFYMPQLLEKIRKIIDEG